MSGSIKNIAQLVMVFSTMTITGTMALLLRIVSVGYLTNFNRKYFIPWSSKLALTLVGVKLILPNNNPLQQGNYFITFNHNSYLDIFALTALGYTDTHFLLSEKTLKVIPLTLSALSIGILYIPMKINKNRRMRFFFKLEQRIKKNKVNIAGSSEGVHHHHHGIGNFNRGVYHMATICKLDIIPLFINVPKESNPFDKYKPFKRGILQVEIMDTISTKTWKIEDLDLNKEKVRALYVNKFNVTHNMNIK